MASKCRNCIEGRRTAKQIKPPATIHAASPVSPQSARRRRARPPDKSHVSHGVDSHDVEDAGRLLEPVRFDDDGTPVYLIEGILASTIVEGGVGRPPNHNRQDVLYYLVKWEGWDEPTWQPYNDLIGCDQAIADFHRRFPNADSSRELSAVCEGRLLHPRSSGLSDSRRLSPKVVVPAKNRKGDNFHQPASVRRTPQLWELKLNARIAARRKHVALISEKDVPDSFYARSPASSNASSNTIANSPESRELTIRNSTGDDSSASHLLSCVREFEYTCLDSSVRTVDGHRLICLGDTAAKDMKSLVVHLQHTSRPSLRLHIRFQPHNFDQHILPWRLDLSVLDALPGLEKLDVVCSPLDLIARGSVQQLAGFNAAIEQELYRLGDRVVFWRHLQNSNGGPSIPYRQCASPSGLEGREKELLEWLFQVKE